MDENREKQTEAPENEKKSYTPASFEKRVAAWVGVVYMVILVLAITILIATGGTGLANTFPLLLPPAAVGAAVISIHRQKEGKMPEKEGHYFTPAILFLCFLAFVIGLVCGIPPLLANFGIATPLIPNP